MKTTLFIPAISFGKNEVRIAYVLKKEDLANTIEKLAEALKVYTVRTL